MSFTLYYCFFKHASMHAQLDMLWKFYITLIYPHSNIWCAMWNPHLGQDIDAVEAVQWFATKICITSWNNMQDIV